MKIKPIKLVICLLIPLAVGGLAALLSMEGMREFEDLVKPPLTPPAWVFPVVWTALYLMMGYASYLVLESRSPKELIETAATVYGCQLLVNFFWPILFFRLRMYLFAFLWLVALWVLVIGCAAIFSRLSKRAGELMLPYILWVTFAGYLNMGVYLLN